MVDVLELRRIEGEVQLSDLTAMLNAQADVINALMRRQSAIDQAVEDLFAGSATAVPTARIRINHALRGKLPSGWSFNEGTIEWSGPTDELTESALIDLALTAGNAAEQISAIRNASAPTAVEDGGE